jgi:hypothetical protein
MLDLPGANPCQQLASRIHFLVLIAMMVIVSFEKAGRSLRR